MDQWDWQEMWSQYYCYVSVTILGTRYILVNKADEFPTLVKSSGQIIIMQAHIIIDYSGAIKGGSRCL